MKNTVSKEEMLIYYAIEFGYKCKEDGLSLSETYQKYKNLCD